MGKNYVLVKKHYTNEAEVITAILKDAKKNNIKINENRLKAFLEDDATIMAKNPGTMSSYGPDCSSNLVYAFMPANNKVMMIFRGNRQVLGNLPNGHKTVSIDNFKVVAQF